MDWQEAAVNFKCAVYTFLITLTVLYSGIFIYRECCMKSLEVQSQSSCYTADTTGKIWKCYSRIINNKSTHVNITLTIHTNYSYQDHNCSIRLVNLFGSELETQLISYTPIKEGYITCTYRVSVPPRDTDILIEDIIQTSEQDPDVIVTAS